MAKGNEQTNKFLTKNYYFLKTHSGNLIVRTAFDSTKAQFFLSGVTKNNIHEYEYRVVNELDSKKGPWTNITKFGTDVSPKDTIIKSLAYIGGFVTTTRHAITVDVRKKGTNKIVSSAVVFWEICVPQLDNIYILTKSKEFLNRLDQFGSNDILKEEIVKWNKIHPSDPIFKKTNHLPKRSCLVPTTNNLLFYFSDTVSNNSQIEYELTKDHQIIQSWRSIENGKKFMWFKDLKPGNYFLRFRYHFQPNQTDDYHFFIERPWYQTHKKLIATYIFIIGLLVLIVFLVLLYIQKKKARKELAKKEKLQLELKAIYAQLNPHFVFNALSSIQGLINKQDIQGANMYLSDFAKLLRNSMRNNNRERTSLNEELITLETYLKLEQLRFGFKYDIKTDGINVFETEIPSLLLQPLLENAVKHGVSSLQENGLINLMISKENDDMHVTIQDNGIGFMMNEDGNGYGLKLTKDRIRLLNQLMKGQTIELKLDEKSSEGTIVKLIFKSWFI